MEGLGSSTFKLAVLFALLTGCASAQNLDSGIEIQADQIIDVHRHASWPESDDANYRTHILDEMDANGVAIAVLAINDYDDIDDWVDAAPGRFLAGTMLACPRNLAAPRYKCFPSDEGWADIDWLRGNVESGKIRAIHEIGPNYFGIAISNPRFAPYFEIAAEFDIPVGIHTGRGPPPGAINSTRSDPNCCPEYDPEMGNPELLRPVLEKHPGLKVWLQHIGAGRPGGYEPFWDETLALLRDYPSVNVDLSITNGVLPTPVYEAALRRLIDAGFGDRIMFGSDNVPTAKILERMASIKWLSEIQRHAILYDNAARFFGIADEAGLGKQ